MLDERATDQPRILTSLQNPLVKRVRKLHKPQGRHQEGVCLLEGTHLLQEACQAGYPLVLVCSTLSWQQRHLELWEEAQQRSDRAETVSETVLAALATTYSPDGVIAVAPRNRQKLASFPLQGIGLALETLQDPGNLGTIIRTAAAAEIQGLWLSADSVDLDHPKVLRSTAGQWFRLPMTISPNLTQVVAEARATGSQIVATCPRSARSYWQVDLIQPTLLLLGNEGSGLSQTLLSQADVQVKIPLAQGVESLNVGITAALLLYETRRQWTFKR